MTHCRNIAFALSIGILLASAVHADMTDRFDRERAQKQISAIEQEKQGRLVHRQRMRDAWKKLYQPSEMCERDPSLISCANAHAAAHKRFMEIYGEMPPRF